MLRAGSANVNGNSDDDHEQRGNVEDVVGPVAPAGEESVEVAEDFFGPEIDSAFAGIAVSEFDYGDALRKEEEEERDDPEPDCDPAVGGDGRDYVEIEDGNYEQENEIAAPEGADQVRLGGGLGGGGQSFFAGCKTAGSSPGLRPGSE